MGQQDRAGLSCVVHAATQPAAVQRRPHSGRVCLTITRREGGGVVGGAAQGEASRSHSRFGSKAKTLISDPHSAPAALGTPRPSDASLTMLRAMAAMVGEGTRRRSGSVKRREECERSKCQLSTKKQKNDPQPTLQRRAGGPPPPDSLPHERTQSTLNPPCVTRHHQAEAPRPPTPAPPPPPPPPRRRRGPPVAPSRPASPPPPPASGRGRGPRATACHAGR